MGDALLSTNEVQQDDEINSSEFHTIRRLKDGEELGEFFEHRSSREWFLEKFKAFLQVINK